MTKTTNKQKGIEKWLGYYFYSSAERTPEYVAFEKEARNYIKKQLDENLELINWSKMHFEFSGFIRNKKTGRFVYFSCPDVRYEPDGWYNDLLIRTAKNEEDYTGGCNNFCKLPELIEKAKELTSN